MIYSMFSKVREEKDTMVVIRKGPWTSEEDSVLMKYVSIHGEGRWNSLARSAGLKRTGKSCRLRWLNYLRPDIRRGNITLQEQLLIFELHSQFGNRWSKIAQHIPGRTDNEIKNYWRTKVQKHAKHLKCDVDSKSFRDAMRYIWMPQLMERISQSSSTPPGGTISNEQQPDIRRVVQGAREDFSSPLGSSSMPEISGSSSSGCCYSEARTHASFGMRDFGDMGRSVNYFEEFEYNNNGVHNQQGGLQHQLNDDQNNAWIVEDSWFQDQLLNDEDIWILGQQLSN